MHPLKDQREGAKYGRGVKYGVTPAKIWLKGYVKTCTHFPKIIFEGHLKYLHKMEKCICLGNCLRLCYFG